MKRSSTTHGIAALLCALCASAVPSVAQEGAAALRARIEADWMAQDGVKEATADYRRACEARRAARLAGVPRAIVFVKHFNMGGSHYAYTEAQTDAQRERNFIPGGALCLLRLDGAEPAVETLLDAGEGVIRDPDVSYDGARILFAWKKSDRGDDYHLYELDVATRAVRQLTHGEGVADYEGCYLPGGGILFNSTRCVQTVDCWWTEVSNLYACDRDGGNIHRLTYDQVHDNYPTVTPDGRVLYTRWEYNDRGQLFPQPLFQMFPDGTGQREFYGNNSWFPTTIIHARGIPGSPKVVAIATGHHSDQGGKLILIDPRRGRQENAGVELVAPRRETPAVRIDAYGQEGERFQHPYPLSESAYLVSYAPQSPGRIMKTGFGLYWMDVDGNRELLVWDDAVSCARPVPLAQRDEPPVRPPLPPSAGPEVARAAGYDASCYVQDLYEGPGLAGVPRGTAKALRIVALEYRAAGIGHNGNGGPAGGAMVSTPIAIGNGSWDVKHVLGTVPVEADGSAHFAAPSRTPFYLQVLDTNGFVIQTMRSWMTLQPGERASCVGCHEDKNRAPPAYARRVLAGTPRVPEPWPGGAQGFSYTREIQPIWDRHCIACHDGSAGRDKSFSLLSKPVEDRQAKRFWSESYLNLTAGGPSNRWLNWISAQSVPPMLEPYAAGAARSGLFPLLERGHYGAKPSRAELDRIACWIDLLVPFCGDYREAAAWTEEERAMYERFLGKRKALETTPQAARPR